jgi:hypothetical protein
MSIDNKNKGQGISTRGWKNQSPSLHERTVMLKMCGKKCFLGTKKSFPICKKNTCTISSKGVYSAYIRARQYRKKGSKYRTVSSKAKKIIKTMRVKNKID